MERRFAWLLLLLAACGDKPGTYIEIHGAASLAKVSVYIGQEACTDQSGTPCPIAPSMLSSRLKASTSPGGTWFRDVNTPFVAGASGGVARVHVEASGPDEMVEIVVLGLDASGTLVQAATIHDVHVPTGGATNLSVTLADAQPVDANEEAMTPHGDGTYALAWTSAMAPTDCVLVERWDAGAADRTFIVPKEDADCDGYLATDASGQKNPLECDQFFFDFSSRTGTSPTCTVLGHVNSVSSCVVGGNGCIDGTGATGTCLPLQAPETCVPNAICDSPCNTASGSAALSSCYNAAGTSPVLHCFIYTDDAGAPCNGTTSISAPDMGHLYLDALFGNGHACKEVAFSTDDSLYTTNWQGQLHAPAPNDGELDLVSPLGGACDFLVQWKQGTGFPSQTAQYGAVDVTVDNDRHMILPLTIEYANCALAPSPTAFGVQCSVATSTDGILNCGR